MQIWWILIGWFWGDEHFRHSSREVPGTAGKAWFCVREMSGITAQFDRNGSLLKPVMECMMRPYTVLEEWVDDRCAMWGLSIDVIVAVSWPVFKSGYCTTTSKLARQLSVLTNRLGVWTARRFDLRNAYPMRLQSPRQSTIWKYAELTMRRSRTPRSLVKTRTPFSRRSCRGRGRLSGGELHVDRRQDVWNVVRRRRAFTSQP